MYYPPSYYSKNPDAPQLDRIVIREDRELRRKKKEILDAFNAKRKALKQQMISVQPSTKPPVPLEEARKRKIVLQSQTIDVQNNPLGSNRSSADDGFRNYEEQKAKLDAANYNKDRNIDNVLQSQQLNELNKRNAEYKTARD